MSEFTPDEIGIRLFLNSPGMLRVVRHYGERIKTRAEILSPVGKPWEPDEHSGRYRSSFNIDVHINGGATHDRAEAIVSNDSPEAVYVEYGHRGREPYHTLLRAATERWSS